MTPSELEKEADRILREDAAKEGYVNKPGGYGFGRYARRYGILTPHDVATIRIVERPLDPLGIGNITRDDDDE